MTIRIFIALALMLAAGFAQGAPRPLLAVEGVQMPAWVEHPNGRRDALTLGGALNDKDRIVTGPGARAFLRLADGNFVKIGEKANLAVDEIGQSEGKVKLTAKASREQLAAWLRETDVPGGGALSKGGKWRVNLAEEKEQYDALRIYDKLRHAGYAAKIRPVANDAGITYRVRISSFATKEDAAALGAKLKGKMGIADPKVSK
jgi:hypothetical protein